MADVVIVGAGLAGLCCALRLREVGIPLQIVEASDGIGGFIIVWQSPGTSIDDDGGIVARLAGPQGQLGSEFAVNSYTTGVQSDPRVFGLGDGRFVITWTSAIA